MRRSRAALWQPRYTLTPAIAPAKDVARALGRSDRTARDLLRDWVEAGWIEIANPSRRGRVYRLSAGYRQFIGDSSAGPAMGKRS